MWCMSGAPRVFDGKMCARDELLHVVHVWRAIFDGKHALVTSLSMWSATCG